MTFKIIVAVKKVVDHNIHIRVKLDESGVELDNVKMSMNPFDENALEEAVRLTEAGIASEVIAVSIGGDGTDAILRNAIAMGAHRAIWVKTEQKTVPLHIAKILQKIITDEQPQLVLLGKQAIDDDCNQTGQMLASLLGWGQGTNISQISLNQHDKHILITREDDYGQQQIKLALPCVLTADLRLNNPRFVSLMNLMKSKKTPIEEKSLDSLGITLQPHIKLIKTTAPAKRQAGSKLESVEELIRILQDKDLIPQGE